MSLLKDFKEFAVKGNAFDLAVGVIIGGAFGKIVTSIVNDIIMPPIGWLIGGIKFNELACTLPPNGLNPEAEPVKIAYGNFIQNCFDFFIIAFCIFMMVRLMSNLTRKKKEETPAPAPPAPTKEELLLTEIRDLLKEKNKS